MEEKPATGHNVVDESPEDIPLDGDAAKTPTKTPAKTADISRRGFVAGLALAASTAAAAGTAGCMPIASSSAEAPSAPAVPVAANLRPGTYTGQAPGHRGTLRVKVKVSADKIEDIEFVEALARTNAAIPPLEYDPFAIYALAMLNDAPQILDTVTERLGKRIVEHQSLKVDAICGATFSSVGYRAAVKDALTQASGDLSAFETDLPNKSSEAAVAYEGFDVVVVGGGAAGTTAAAAATARGAKVLLIEKSARIGGCGSLSTGLHAVGSRLQRDLPEDSPEGLVEAPPESLSDAPSEEPSQELSKDAQANLQESTSADPPEPTLAPSGGNAFFAEVMRQGLWYPKAPIVSQFLAKGGAVVDFLVEKGGFDFEAGPEGVSYAEDSIINPMAHDSWQRVADTVDTVLFETTVTGLIQGMDGRVTGVLAQGFDGRPITVEGVKAVIFATGGFMNNEELQKHYNHAFFSTRFALQQNVGEGLQLMLGAGAREYHIGGMNIHITQPIGELEGFDDYSAMIPYTLHAAPNMLRVNQRGERFASEALLADTMVGNGNCLAAQGRNFFTIVSAQQMQTMAEGGLAATGLTEQVFAVNFNFYPVPIAYRMAAIVEAMEAGVREGFILKGATFEALAKEAGFKPEVFRAHIERYEAACAAGLDELYYKDPALLFPLGKGPYYAIINEHCPYSTMGGVEVDEQMRVLDKEGDVIEGLFAAGCESIGALYGGSAYSDLGGLPFGWACFSGYAAGVSAAGRPLV